MTRRRGSPQGWDTRQGLPTLLRLMCGTPSQCHPSHGLRPENGFLLVLPRVESGHSHPERQDQSSNVTQSPPQIQATLQYEGLFCATNSPSCENRQTQSAQQNPRQDQKHSTVLRPKSI